MKRIDDLTYRLERAGAITKRYLKTIFGHSAPKYGEITQYSGSSFQFGKKETVDFIETVCPDKNSKILDVGPGRGVYNRILREKGYLYFDAVEIYLPYIEKFELKEMYNKVFHRNIIGFEYVHYDIIIMGDIIEHLRIKNAQKVIKYAQEHSNLVVVAVPYKSKQIGSQLDGSGDHRQADLTREVFLKRYTGFELLVDNHQVGVFFSKQV